MKIISGDFVSEYNRMMDEYRDRQGKLDEEFKERISRVVSEETSRLERTFPVPFEDGDRVKTSDDNVGIVVNCPVDLQVYEDEAYHGPLCGPSRYFEIRTESDEDIITCEGLVRRVNVKFQSSQLEMDWGITENIKSYWPDDLIYFPED